MKFIKRTYLNFIVLELDKKDTKEDEYFNLLDRQLDSKCNQSSFYLYDCSYSFSTINDRKWTADCSNCVNEFIEFFFSKINKPKILLMASK